MENDKALRFGYVAKILYAENGVTAFLSYGQDGKAIGQPRKMKASDIPVMLFQMVDAGYTVSMEIVDKSTPEVRAITAVSIGWTENFMKTKIG